MASVLILCLLAIPQLALADQTDISDSRELFIELSASEDRVYIQQELILTVRLFFASNLIRGELSAPEHSDAVIEQLGRQREFSQERDGQSYRVVERRYSVFPQTTGTLSLPAISFEGLARHPRGHAYRLRTSATLFDVEVRDIPDNFSGNTWLPARSLTISERGLPDGGSLSIGQSLNRSIQIEATGLQGPVLPPLADQYPDSLRSYPETPVRNSAVGPSGISGSLEQSIALVPVAAGNLVLPEIRVHWWDVTTDEPRVAVLPARRYTVMPSPGSSEPIATTAEEPAENSDPTVDTTASTGFWPWLSLLFGLGWAGTGCLWWCQRRKWQARKSIHQETPAANLKTPEFRAMTERLADANPDWVRHFIHWTQSVADHPVHTVDQALAHWQDPLLTDLVQQWHQETWGNPAVPSERKLAAVTAALTDRLKLCQKRGRRAPAHHKTTAPLPGFYPEGLSPNRSP
ncbi:hypothetical protein [uncultured Marinobacter sp.]|uniref:hypothetical protein n=1 Tax=uncultured Marinobacter sp. TaxID=187379 RepID=UPI0030DA36FF